MMVTHPPNQLALPAWVSQVLGRLDASQQQAAAADPNTPLLIQAGAGSGKTQTMAARIAFLIASGVSPSSILGICFTRKAAEELRSRVQRMLQSTPCAVEGKALKLRTLHAFGLECLRRYDRIDDTTDVYDHQRQRKVAEDVVRAHARVARDADAVERLLDFVNAAKAKKTLPPVETNPARQESFLFRFYETALHEEKNAVDFGDLQHMFYELLKPQKAPVSGESSDAGLGGGGTAKAMPGGCPVSAGPLVVSPICDSLRHRFTHIIVDEFQDLNEIQFEIVALMAGDACRVTCVGDPHQCIYSWRGAMPKIFDQWKSRFPQTQLRMLGINYRSDPPIVGAANSLVRATQAPFHVRHSYDPVLLSCLSTADECAAVAFMIESFVRVRDPDVVYGDIAVLCRTRARVADYVRALRDYGIPTVELRSLAGDGLSTVSSLLAFLRLCINAHRDDDVRVVLTSAPRRLSPRVSRAFMMSLYATRDDLQRRDAWSSDTGRDDSGGGPSAAGFRYSLYNVLKSLVHHSFSVDVFPLMGKVAKPTAVILREFVAILEAAQQLFDEFHHRFEGRGVVPTTHDLADVVASCIDLIVTKAHYDEGDADAPLAGRKGTRKRVRRSSVSHAEEASSTAPVDGCASKDSDESPSSPPPFRSLRELLEASLATVRQEAASHTAPQAPAPVAIVKKEEEPGCAAAIGSSVGTAAHQKQIIDVDVDSDVEEFSPVHPDSSSRRNQQPQRPPREWASLTRPEQLLLYVLDEFMTVAPTDEFGLLDVHGAARESAATDGGGKLAAPNTEARARPAVQVGTVHSAKGLEWPVVIVPGCYDGHFPLNNDDEERRVFYVAMSRAETQLVLVTAQTGPVPAEGRATHAQPTVERLRPSPFIQDIIRQRGHVVGTYDDIRQPRSTHESVDAQPDAPRSSASEPSPSTTGACGSLQLFDYAELKARHHQRQLEM